ncbi:MAG: hypothetical protein K9M97_05195 [Akkermansiaceae bacterium]|nr:hypothetical protein [Akkermansiaceae bacterium]
MRNSLLLLLAGAVVALAEPAPPTPGQMAGGYYAKGVAAEKAGDVGGARAAYTQALKANPRHANCRYRLKELELNKATIAKKGRELQFDKVIIPVIQIDGATLQESLTALSTMIAKESKGKLTPNFIIQDPNGNFARSKINLNLKGLPASAVIKYMLTQSNAKARYDEHAVVIMPK